MSEKVLEKLLLRHTVPPAAAEAAAKDIQRAIVIRMQLRELEQRQTAEERQHEKRLKEIADERIRIRATCPHWTKATAPSGLTMCEHCGLTWDQAGKAEW